MTVATDGLKLFSRARTDAGLGTNVHRIQIKHSCKDSQVSHLGSQRAVESEDFVIPCTLGMQ